MSFFQFDKLWGQFHREKNNIKINCETSFMFFSFIYPIFLLNGTYISPTLTSTARCSLTFPIKKKKNIYIYIE